MIFQHRTYHNILYKSSKSLSLFFADHINVPNIKPFLKEIDPYGELNGLLHDGKYNLFKWSTNYIVAAQQVA